MPGAFAPPRAPEARQAQAGSWRVWKAKLQEQSTKHNNRAKQPFKYQKLVKTNSRQIFRRAFLFILAHSQFTHPALNVCSWHKWKIDFECLCDGHQDRRAPLAAAVLGLAAIVCKAQIFCQNCPNRSRHRALDCQISAFFHHVAHSMVQPSRRTLQRICLSSFGDVWSPFGPIGPIIPGPPQRDQKRLRLRVAGLAGTDW